MLARMMLMKQNLKKFALSFVGGNSYVDCGGAVSIKPRTAISICAWVKFNTLATGVRFLSDWHQLTLEDRWLFFAGTTGSFVFHANTDTPAFTPTMGDWYLVTGTYDGSYLRLYINNDLIGAVLKTGLLPAGTSSKTVRLGKQQETGNGFDGEMDDVRIYSRALTLTEIGQLHAGGAVSSEGLVGWWKMDEGSGLVAVDSSGNGNTGAIFNAIYTESDR
jgi:hypothetical protein